MSIGERIIREQLAARFGVSADQIPPLWCEDWTNSAAEVPHFSRRDIRNPDREIEYAIERAVQAARAESEPEPDEMPSRRRIGF